MYCTPPDLLVKYGPDELARLATPDDTRELVDPALLRALIGGGDTSAWTPEQIAVGNRAVVIIESAILFAERLIDSYVSRRYTLPVSESAELVDCCKALARSNLYDDKRPDPIQWEFDFWIRWLEGVASGRIRLPDSYDTQTAADAAAGGGRGSLVVVAPPTVFTDDQLAKML